MDCGRDGSSSRIRCVGVHVGPLVFLMIWVVPSGVSNPSRPTPMGKLIGGSFLCRNA